MQVEIKAPEDLEDGGDILDVFVSVGEEITEGQDLIEVETDKATTPVPSSHTGKVLEIKVGVGDTIAAGGVSWSSNRQMPRLHRLLLQRPSLQLLLRLQHQSQPRRRPQHLRRHLRLHMSVHLRLLLLHRLHHQLRLRRPLAVG